MSLRPKAPRGTLFVTGRITQWPAWELVGVFDTQKLATDACLDETYFVGPVRKNKPIADRRVTWPGCVYPREIEGAR